MRHENPRSVKGFRHEQRTRALLKDFRLEWIDTDPVATDNEATICSELSPMRRHTDTEIIRSGINYGIKLEPINTNQEVKVDRTAIRSKPPSEKGHIEMQAGQEKAGASPHTLQERRPRDNKETQRNSQTDEIK